MTISSNLRKAGPFAGNAATTAFPFAYKVFTTSDVVVTKSDGVTETTLTLTTDYTVALNPDQNANPGGTVTYPASGSPLPVGQTLTLSSSLQELQPTSITNQGGFYPKIIEDALDRLTILVQQIKEQLNRSLRLPISVTGVSTQLPIPIGSQVIAWKPDGSGLQNVGPVDNTLLAVQLADNADAAKGATLIGYLGGTLRTYLNQFATSAGASIIGWSQSGTGAVLRTVQEKLREIYSLKDSGATGDNVADDTTKVQAAINTLCAEVTPATGYKVSALDIPANTVLKGRQVAGPITLSGTGWISINGSNVLIEDLKVVGQAADQVIYAGASASNVTLVNPVLSTNSTSANGHGVQINKASCNNWELLNPKIDVYDFGVLANTTAGGSKGLTIVGGAITTDHGDCIEVNSPSTAFEDVIVVGTQLKVTAGSGTAAGFGVGLAHVNGAVVIGTVSERSWLEADHIEDGSKNVTIVGNIRKNCVVDGLRHLIDGFGANQAQAKAISIIGNHYEANAIVAGTAGIRVVQSANGTPYSDAIHGNIVRKFEAGLWLGGLAIHRADGNVIDSCTYAMRVEEGNSVYTRVTGTNHVINTPTLLYVSNTNGAMVQAGKFICDAAPTNIILKAAPGTTRPGCSVAGFSWPQTFTNTAGVNSYSNLFPLGALNRMTGKINIQARDNAGIANNVWYAADVLWDGTTLTLANVISESNGALALTAPALRVNAGQLQVGLFDANAITIRIDMNFDGIYMA